MRVVRLACCLLLLWVGAGIALLAFASIGLASAPPAPASSVATATAQSTAPATTTAATSRPADEGDVRATVTGFTKALFTGDEKASFDHLYLPTDDIKKQADAVLGPEIFMSKYENAMKAEFRTYRSSLNVDFPIPNRSIDDVIKDEVERATVTVTGDTAEYNVGGGMNPVYLIRDKGAWKIDFEKVQRATNAPLDKAEFAACDAQIAVYKAMIADIQAHKFKTKELAVAELDKRLATIPSATRSAASSRPAAATAPAKQ